MGRQAEEKYVFLCPQNNLKASSTYRILLLQNVSVRTATSQTSLSHSLTRVHSHWEWGFFLQLQYSHPTPLTSMHPLTQTVENICGTDEGRFTVLWEETRRKKPVQSYIVNKAAHHVCAFPSTGRVVLWSCASARLSISILSAITCSLLPCFFNEIY